MLPSRGRLSVDVTDGAIRAICLGLNLLLAEESRQSVLQLYLSHKSPDTETWGNVNRTSAETSPIQNGIYTGVC